ncbi:putative protease SohB [compost metagenome]
MAHALVRLREKLVNTPLLVDTETFNSVVNYLNSRNAGDVILTPVASAGEDGGHSRILYNEDTQTAVMHIEGPLTYRPFTFMGYDCGGTNYTDLKQDVETAIEMGAKTIAWMVDSGGGEAHQMSDSAKYIRKLLDASGVRLLAYVDGRSASAAYGLTAIADEVIASRDSELGSIGVLVQLINDSEALKKEGYERTFITAGDDKIPFAEDGTWREGFLADLQKKVDVCYADFTEHVAASRGISVEAVRSTQARMFFATDAVELGLADKVMTPEEFYSYLADQAQTNMSGDAVSKSRIFKFLSPEDDSMQLAELQAQLTELTTKLTASEESYTSAMRNFAEVNELLTAELAKNDTLAEALATAEGELTSLKAEKAEAALAARKTSLSAVVAADRVDGLMTSLAALDDATFQAVVDGFATTKQTIEQSVLMTELGQDAEDVPSVKTDADADAADTATRAAIARMARK